jgi:hypothetical protein
MGFHAKPVLLFQRSDAGVSVKLGAGKSSSGAVSRARD